MGWGGGVGLGGKGGGGGAELGALKVMLVELVDLSASWLGWGSHMGRGDTEQVGGGGDSCMAKPKP